MIQPHKARPVLAFLLILNSLALFILWPVILSTGVFAGGLMAYQPQGTVPGLFVLADLLTAAVVIGGGAALWAGAKWADKVTLLGLGMFVYSSISSLGWCLHNQPILALPKVSMLLVAALVVPKLLRGYHEADSEEEPSTRPAPRRRKLK